MHPPARKLLDQVRDTLRLKHYSYSTEKQYLHWIRRFILFHNKQHPASMGREEIEAFLIYLAIDRKVAASTQNQALHALLFLYKSVLEVPLNEPVNAIRAKRPKHIPTVLTKKEVAMLLDCMQGTTQLMAKILCGSGLRVSECVRLRVKDVDLNRFQITVRSGKGRKDRKIGFRIQGSGYRNQVTGIRR